MEMQSSTAERASATVKSDADQLWSRTHLAIFRIVFCFVSLYTVDLVAGFFQRFIRAAHGSSFVDPFTAPMWHPLISWIGQHMLHLAQPVQVSGLVGQDSIYEYILRGTEMALALVFAAGWGFLDRSSSDYRTLNAWLRIFVRTVLACEMLFYGLGKVPPNQFGLLSLVRQAQPLGQMAPMPMLWAFMAASPGYTLLCGLVEVGGGLLLLTRRTTMLGALITLGAMVNVLLLNVFYDVNQKIRCLYYVLLALYLAAPQLPGLWRLLVSRQPAVSVVEPKIFGPRPLRMAIFSLPALFALSLAALAVPSDLRRYRAERQTNASRGPDYGIWHVDSFTVANPQTPLLSPESLREFGLAPGHDHWHQVIFDSNNAVEIRLENGQYNHVEARIDQATGDTILIDSGDKDWSAMLHFERKSPSSLFATGTVNGDPTTIVLTREGDGTNHLAAPPRWISDGRRW